MFVHRARVPLLCGALLAVSLTAACGSGSSSDQGSKGLRNVLHSKSAKPEVTSCAIVENAHAG